MADALQQKRLMIAAPSSGSGKTVICLALLRALKNAGLNVKSAKAGPDYIDPQFHALASGASSVNLDPWAMGAKRISTLANNQDDGLLLIEAMMGLFDGAADGSGSAADLAQTLDCPVLLVVDAAKQSHSIAALVRGFCNHRSSINVAGVILNKVGSPRHEALLRSALDAIHVPVFGAIHRDASLQLPERHLGLVQAGEIDGIEAFIENAAEIVSKSVNLDDLVEAFKHAALSVDRSEKLPVLGQHIAIAQDEAFAFLYPHILADWRSSQAELSFFSPLANEAPRAKADAVFLPGGYPELHLEKLSNADVFKAGMKNAFEQNTLIYGECGGYMVMGEGITGKDGVTHGLLALLNWQSGFAKRKLHLGYRKIETKVGFPLGQKFAAHEFHYTVAIEEVGESMFHAQDALGENLGNCGLCNGSAMGSYMHIIDQWGKG